jgi:hypothetical protein
MRVRAGKSESILRRASQCEGGQNGMHLNANFERQSLNKKAPDFRQGL